MIEAAIEFLKQHGIEDCYEMAGILTIPCHSPEELDKTISTAKGLLKECGFNKSWRVDPYHYERQKSLAAEMFKSSEDDSKKKK